MAHGEPRPETEMELAMVFASEAYYRSRREVVDAHPEAAKIVKVEGGWGVFESLADYENWKRQK